MVGDSDFGTGGDSTGEHRQPADKEYYSPSTVIEEFNL